MIPGVPIPITSGLPAGAAAGDYLLTVTGLNASVPTYGQVTQIVTGTTKSQRTAVFVIWGVPTTVTAEVRVTGPGDIFVPVGTTQPVTWTSITLTPATYSYVSRGSDIIAPDGTVAALHGTQGSFDMVDSDFANAFAAFPKLNEWRVNINEECWDTFFTAAQASANCNRYNSGNLTGAAAYQAHVNQDINDIISAGRTVIITTDFSGRDTPSYIPPTQADLFGPDQRSLVLYDQLVQLWGSNPSVIFETTNEPKVNAYASYPPNNTSGPILWRVGGNVTVSGMTWNMPGVQTIADRIRADGATNLILINGTNYGSNLTPVELHPVLGTNLAYSYHAYHSPDNAPTYPPSLDWAVAPVIDPNGSYKYAGMMTEFGTGQSDSGGSASAYLQSTISWAEKYSNGWSAFGWQPLAFNQFGLLSSYNPLTLNSKGVTVTNNF
jgi:hypothetical protein